MQYLAQHGASVPGPIRSVNNNLNEILERHGGTYLATQYTPSSPTLKRPGLDVIPNKEITIFDFDDCVYGWFVMDIATLLFDILVVYQGAAKGELASNSC